MARRSGKKKTPPARKNVAPAKDGRNFSIIPGGKDPIILIDALIEREFLTIPKHQKETQCELVKRVLGCTSKKHHRHCSSCKTKLALIKKKPEFTQRYEKRRQEWILDKAWSKESRLLYLNELAFDHDSTASEKARMVKLYTEIMGDGESKESANVQVNIQNNSETTTTVLGLLKQKYNDDEGDSNDNN